MRFLRYTGRPRTDDAAYKAVLADDEISVLDPWSGADGNIAWALKLDGRAVTMPFRTHARDLFDLAAAVYAADEIVPRIEGVDRWTREMDFTLPVVDGKAWKSAERTLVECLGFLSGDVYRFTWLDRPNTGPKRRIHRNRLGGGYDTVCLFSGGVDSLLGAAALLGEGRRVLLVGHHADRVTSSAQTKLFDLLRRKFPGRASLLQLYLERSRKGRQRYALPDKVEISHRSRSFLFLASGVVAAIATGTKTLHIPENGLIALNSPLGASRRGTLSTRTTHPRYIELFNLMLTTLAIDVKVQNPFAYQSKTDMVEAIRDPDIVAALQQSVSCAHAGNLWRERALFTHCGYCVPCLYRRASFLAAGMGESGYQHDVFKELPNLSPDKGRDLRLLVRFARVTVTASEVDLVATVLRHGGFMGGVHGEEYTERAAMLKRWATGFLELTRRRSSPQTRRILGL